MNVDENDFIQFLRFSLMITGFTFICGSDETYEHYSFYSTHKIYNFKESYQMQSYGHIYVLSSHLNSNIF